MSRWTRWLLMLIACHALAAGLAIPLVLSGRVFTGQVLGGLGDVATLVVLASGMYTLGADRRTQWVALASGTALASLWTFKLFHSHWPRAAWSVAGIWAMFLSFNLGVRLIRTLLLPGTPVVAMARITLDEALRMKIAMVFLGLLMVLLPLLPSLLDPTEKIEYRMRFFLTWSMNITGFFLSVMTIFMACGVIAQDVKNRQIFMTAVKPISRAEYLLGRWLGLVLLDLLLLGIAGAGVYVFTFMVAAGPDQGRSDRMRLENEVLVARERVAPSHPDANYLSARFDEQLKRLRELNPDVWGDGTQPLNEKQRRQVELELLNQWHLVRAGEHQTFLFTGLEQARIDKRYLVLRYKPNMALAPPDQMARMVFRINGNFWPVSPVQLDSGASAFAVHQIAVPDKQVATLDIPYWMVDESGRLAIEIHNNHPENIVAGVERVRIHPHSMTFTPGKDIELFFRVEGFTPNFLRSMVILWVRLNFLAMLGLLAGSFLQFHVAALMASAIYLVAEGAAFINESLDLYQELNIIGEPFFDKIVISWQTFVDRINKEMYFSCFRILVRIVGHIFVFFVPSFGEYQPVLLFANGRIVPAEMVRGALLQIGVLWTGLCGLIAWLVFRRKELARVIV